jgi:hypothetical protein
VERLDAPFPHLWIDMPPEHSRVRICICGHLRSTICVTRVNILQMCAVAFRVRDEVDLCSMSCRGMRRRLRRCRRTWLSYCTTVMDDTVWWSDGPQFEIFRVWRSYILTDVTQPFRAQWVVTVVLPHNITFIVFIVSTPSFLWFS